MISLNSPIDIGIPLNTVKYCISKKLYYIVINNNAQTHFLCPLSLNLKCIILCYDIIEIFIMNLGNC